MQEEKLDLLFSFLIENNYLENGISELISNLINKIINSNILSEQDNIKWARIKTQIDIITK